MHGFDNRSSQRFLLFPGFLYNIFQKAHSVKAEESQKETKTVEQKEVIKSEKTKNSTTFALANGKKQTVFYGQDVRFETKNGKLKDYDPSLVKIQNKKSENGNDLKDYVYENEEGDKKHYLPKMRGKRE